MIGLIMTLKIDFVGRQLYLFVIFTFDTRNYSWYRACDLQVKLCGGWLVFLFYILISIPKVDKKTMLY